MLGPEPIWIDKRNTISFSFPVRILAPRQEQFHEPGTQRCEHRQQCILITRTQNLRKWIIAVKMNEASTPNLWNSVVLCNVPLITLC